jgi:hypothetical protein
MHRQLWEVVGKTLNESLHTSLSAHSSGMGA